MKPGEADIPPGFSVTFTLHDGSTQTLTEGRWMQVTPGGAFVPLKRGIVRRVREYTSRRHPYVWVFVWTYCATSAFIRIITVDSDGWRAFNAGLLVVLAFVVYFRGKEANEYRRTEADHQRPCTISGITAAGITFNGPGTYHTGPNPGVTTFVPGYSGSADPGVTKYVYVPIPEVAEPVPVLAGKYALVTRRNERVRFEGIGHGTSYASPLAEAVCVFRAHTAPDLDCSCGFYAAPDDLLHNAHAQPGMVRLSVELSGRIIEHESGYRAQWQRVLRADFLPVCVICDSMMSEQADVYVLTDAVMPLCAGCAQLAEDIAPPLALDALSRVLGVEIGWLDKW